MQVTRGARSEYFLSVHMHVLSTRDNERVGKILQEKK
jgi:hypothetical protein